MKRPRNLDAFLAEIELAGEIRIIQSKEKGMVYFSEGDSFCIRLRRDMVKPLKCGGYGVCMDKDQLKTLIDELTGILEVFG